MNEVLHAVLESADEHDYSDLSDGCSVDSEVSMDGSDLGDPHNCIQVGFVPDSGNKDSLSNLPFCWKKCFLWTDCEIEIFEEAFWWVYVVSEDSIIDLAVPMLEKCFIMGNCANFYSMLTST